jgi:hypothetical protein
VAHAPIRLRHAHDFHRSKLLFVEIDGSGCAFDSQIWGYVVIALRNRFYFVCHKKISFRSIEILRLFDLILPDSDRQSIVKI